MVAKQTAIYIEMTILKEHPKMVIQTELKKIFFWKNLIANIGLWQLMEIRTFVKLRCSSSCFLAH